jgi:hypothetical protein
LAAVAARLEPAEAARVLGQAARVLGLELGTAVPTSNRRELAEGLAAVAAGLEPAEAARVLRKAARVLELALEGEENADNRRALAAGLTAVAGRREPSEVARVLILTLQKETDPDGRQALAEQLATTAGWLEPAAAARVCAAAVDTFRAAEPETAGVERYTLQGGMARLMQALEPEQAVPLSRALAFDLCSRLDVNGSDHYLLVDASLTDAGRPEVSRRAAALTTALGLSGGGPLAALPALAVASEPLPCRLSTQDLVDLLKMPTCFGEARKVVLKHIGNRYRREFANSWDFVHFAQEQHLDLDFTSPPKRPARR